MSKRRNAVARDLRTPKYRLRIVPDKRDKLRRQLHEIAMGQIDQNPIIPPEPVFEAMAHQGANAVRLALRPQTMQPRLRCEWDVFGGWRWVDDR